MKVYELLINEDDELSGVSLLSIVKNPATNMSWEVFNQELPHHECYVEEDINPELLGILDNYGDVLTQDLLDWTEVMDLEEYNHKFYSVSSKPNQKDPMNDLSLDSITRYIYVIDTGAGAVLKPESRQFCRRMIGAGRVYSRQDLMNISNEIASDPNTFKVIPRSSSIPNVDVFNFKGGKNCYHRYKALVFNLKPNETYAELLARIPQRAGQGVAQADNVYEGSDRPFLSEALHYNMSSQNELKPLGFYMGLFYYPSVKSALMAEPKAKRFTKVKINEMEGWSPMYIAEEYFEGSAKVIDRFEIKEKFVKVPEYIREAAERAVDWTEENSWGSCSTPVGKKRANDLADPSYNPSLEILTRMYSYGSRHKVDWESSKSIEEGCGFLSLLSWGFSPSNYDEAMAWLERQIDGATQKKENFSVDNYKGEITAVVFEPDTYIYRFSEGKSYYVFMSAETIKKMLMKVSRMKETGKLKNFINLEHSDFVFDGNDVYTYENWLVGEDPKKDKSYELFGREMKPGTWITTIAFKNIEIFEKYVLSNKTTGVSLEGLFTEVPFNFTEVSRETFVEPRAGETESDFISRCVPKLLAEGKNQDQALGACYGMFESKFDFPIKASINTNGMTPYLDPETSGLTTEESFMYLGDYEGAPAYSTESGADSKAKEMGCSGTHYMEGQGYFPCKTHAEATKLYQSELIFNEVKKVMKDYLKQ